MIIRGKLVVLSFFLKASYINITLKSWFKPRFKSHKNDHFVIIEIN